jgi:vancomycin permeability regulator SanA
VGERSVRSALVRLILGGVLVGALIVGGTVFRVWQVARLDDRAKADVVVVLGAAQYDGTPSAVLGSRLDHAARLWRDGVAPVIVTVGGRRVGDNYTEAQAGRKYLTSYGIPAGACVNR